MNAPIIDPGPNWALAAIVGSIVYSIFFGWALVCRYAFRTPWSFIKGGLAVGTVVAMFFVAMTAMISSTRYVDPAQMNSYFTAKYDVDRVRLASDGTSIAVVYRKGQSSEKCDIDIVANEAYLQCGKKDTEPPLRLDNSATNRYGGIMNLNDKVDLFNAMSGAIDAIIGDRKYTHDTDLPNFVIEQLYPRDVTVRDKTVNIDMSGHAQARNEYLCATIVVDRNVFESVLREYEA